MFVDINCQLRHGLKCMSEYAHIVFFTYVACNRKWHIALHLCTRTLHENRCECDVDVRSV